MSFSYRMPPFLSADDSPAWSGSLPCFLEFQRLVSSSFLWQQALEFPTPLFSAFSLLNGYGHPSASLRNSQVGDVEAPRIFRERFICRWRPFSPISGVKNSFKGKRVLTTLSFLRIYFFPCGNYASLPRFPSVFFRTVAAIYCASS